MFERSVGKKPVPYIASSRTSTGGITGVNPSPRGGRERTGRAPWPRAPRRRRCTEARARDARRTLHDPTAPTRVCLRGDSNRAARRRGGPPPRPPPLPVGRRVVRRIRHESQGCVAVGLRGRELLLGGLELALHLLERGGSSAMASPSASSASGARRPAGRASASARPRRAARRTPPPRPCARARRETPRDRRGPP